MRYLRVGAHDAERVRALLAKENLLDRRMKVLNSARYVLLPLVIDGQKAIKVIGGVPKGARIIEREGEPRIVRATYMDLLRKRLTKRELGMVARGYDVLGNIAIVELSGDLKGREQEVGRAIIETNKGISTVLAKSGPVSGVYRKRKLRHIYGAETYTATYRENGCTFVFDARKAFFSGRLSFERGRVDRLAGNGERVAVAGAGVGPFAIEIAKHHPMSSVLAIELNRSAYVYMKRNIKLNKTGNVEPVQGDFRSVANARKGYADRVIVPMPTVSIDMLPSVFMIAKPAATVHLYAFCRSDGVDALKERIKLTAHEHGRSARFIGRREVRPYSRDEIEVVLDIRLGMRRRRASAQ